MSPRLSSLTMPPLAITSSIYAVLIEEVNVEFEKIEEWTTSNRLSVNVDKTFMIVFSNRLNDVVSGARVLCDITEVKITSKAKFLGIYMDIGLKFDRHIELISRVSKSFFHIM